MRKIFVKIATTIQDGLNAITPDAPGRVRIDNDIALRIVSCGGNADTQIFTPGGEEIMCWQSLEIEKIDMTSGIIHATIKIEVRLG